MRSPVLIWALLHAGTVFAATNCQMDACYKQVAVQSAGGPNLASRRRDCSAVIKEVRDDDKTITFTRYSTVPTGTTTTTTDTTITATISSTTFETSTSTISETVVASETTTTFSTATQLTSSALMRRDVAAARATFAPRFDSREEMLSVLEQRDRIIISGSKPSYASSCKNLQSYATACLCWGISPSVIRPSTTITITVSQTSTSTAHATGSDSTTISTTISELTSITIAVTSTQTETSTSVTTAFQTVQPTFYTLNEVVSGRRLGQGSGGPFYFKTTDTGASLKFAQFGNNAQPSAYRLSQSGNKYNPLYVYLDTDERGSLTYNLPAASNPNIAKFQPIYCSIGSDDSFTCVGSGPCSDWNSFYMDATYQEVRFGRSALVNMGTMSKVTLNANLVAS